MKLKKLHLALLLAILVTTAQAQQIFTSEKRTETGVSYNKLYYKYADDMRNRLMVIAAPQDSTQYSGEISIPSYVEITDTVNYDEPYTTELKVVKIDKEAFRGSSISSIRMNGIEEVGKNAFLECSKLKAAQFDTIPDLLFISFANEYANPLYVAKRLFLGNNKEETKWLRVPSTFGSINAYAFAGCEGLDSVYIEKGIKDVRYKAFYGCKNLKKARFASIEALCTTGFDGREANPLYYAHHLYVDSIGTEVTNVEIPASVTAIGFAAFAGCSEITKLTLRNVKSIGGDAFYGCDNLYTVDYPSLASLTAIWYGNEYSNPTRYAKMLLVNGSNVSNLTISTDVNDYAFYGARWLESVNFTSDVRKIGNAAFRNCTNLTNVTIKSNGLEEVGQDAFNGCTSISNIFLPSTLKTIGVAAFRNCGQLASITIPEATTSIGEETFLGCGSLKSANINAAITTLPKRMFKDCSSLASVKLEKSIQTINDETFSGCTSLTKLPEGGTITSILGNAFAKCNSFKELTLPDSIKTIGKRAFTDCKNLTNLFIPKSVNGLTIGSEAFVQNNLQNVYAYPAVAPKADPTAFGEAPSGIHLFYNEEAKGYDEKPWSNFDRTVFAVKRVLYFIDNDTAYCDSIQVGDKIVARTAPEREGWTFSGWQEEIPAIMPNYDLEIHGYFTTRANIDGLTYLIEPTKTETMVVADEEAYQNLSNATIPDSITFDQKKYRVTAIEAHAFKGCEALQEVTMSDSLLQMGAGAFADCSQIAKIELSRNVTQIADSLFYNCGSLVDVVIPDTVSYIGNSAFNRCGSLNLDSLPKHLENLGELAFCKSGISYMKIPAQLQQMGSRVFLDCSHLDSIRFEQDCKLHTLPANTFQNCSSLKSFTLAPATKTIGSGAFLGCTAIQQLILTDVETIGTYAFSGCTKLSDITLPESTETLQGNAFADCNSISQITINDLTAPSAAASAFSETTYQNANLYVPDVNNYKDKSPWKKFGERIIAIAENPLIYLVDGKVYGDTVIVRVGTIITPRTEPTKEGRAFSGWRGLPTVMPNDTVMVTGAFKYQLVYQNEETKEPVLTDSLFYDDNVAEYQKKIAQQLAIEGYRYEIADTLLKMPAQDTIVNVRYYPTETIYTDNGLRYHIYTEVREGVDEVHAELIAGETAYTLSSISVPDSINYANSWYPVTVIGTDAFKGCFYLKNVSLPDNIKTIGTQAFRNCGSLQDIEIPSAVTTLGEEMFWGCSNLKNVVFKNDNAIERLPANMFQDCVALETIDLPASLTSIANDAFRGCEKLKEIEINENVTSIGQRAFKGCGKLESISIANKKELPEAVENTFDEQTYETATLYVSAEIQEHIKAPWDNFRNIELGDSASAEQCQKPLISYIKGELIFSCETPDAKITTEVRINDAKKSQEKSQKLTQTYVITAYATASKMKRSDVSRATMTWTSGSPVLQTTGFDKVELQENPNNSNGIPGDMNGDNKITAEDAALILKQITSKKEDTGNDK